MKNRGSALIISLLSLALLGALVLNIGGVVRSSYLSSSSSGGGNWFQASYNAFSGVQYAIDRILADLGNNEIDAYASNGSASFEETGDENDTAGRNINFSVSWPAFNLSWQDTKSGTVTSYGYQGDYEIRVKAGIKITREDISSTKTEFTTRITNWEEDVQ